LVRADIPDQLHLGKPAPLRLTWRITQLPTVPFASWRYDVFAKLLDASGKTLSQADASSIPGASWRVSDQVSQALELAVPDAGASQAPYTVEVSLYDRSQGRNAVFSASDRLRDNGVALAFAVKLAP
jgi:hypothetical protein